jgi:Skp family chaperone for outer membrane proteins
MSKRLSVTLLAAVAALGLASPMMAQSRAAVSGAELDAAAATSPAPRGEAVRALLSTEQAQKVAGQMGVSATDLTARVGALDDVTLDGLARQTGLGDPNLAGGADTIVISTTAIIIILLILILISD